MARPGFARRPGRRRSRKSQSGTGGGTPSPALPGTWGTGTTVLLELLTAVFVIVRATSIVAMFVVDHIGKVTQVCRQTDSASACLDNGQRKRMPCDTLLQAAQAHAV